MQDFRLCLNMIVKNESAIIERCLESVAPHITCWVILDTGSDDGTPRLIEDFFRARGLPGRVHCEPFIDFSTSRNLALDRCRQSGFEYDYILLIDADMELVVEDVNWLSDLSGEACSMRQVGALAYDNVRLLRHDSHARYRGITHEYLDTSGKTVRLQSAYMLDHACGSNRSGKTQRDIALLKRGLGEEPGNSRYLFYLAQSLKEAGEFEEAAECYRQRIEAGGWEEECWYAAYQSAVCQFEMGLVSEGVNSALSAWNRRSWRAEPLALIASHYRKTGQHNLCCEFAVMGLRIPRPADDRLFIELDVYEWRLQQELSIAGYYASDATYAALGHRYCEQLATNPDVPASVRHQARRNLKYYANAAEKWLGIQHLGEFEAPPEPGWVTFNPSICQEGSVLHLVLRQSNYRMENRRYVIDDPDGIIKTRNWFATLGVSQTIENIRLLGLDPDHDDPQSVLGRKVTDFPVQGHEDCRLFRWKGRWWSSATVRNSTDHGLCQMALLQFGDSMQIVDEILLSVEWASQHQKNWMPFVFEEDLYFVYSLAPTVILKYNPTERRVEKFTERATPLALEHLRGGAQLLRLESGWLGICHESVADAELPGAYLHRFFSLDDQFRLDAVSDAFSFSGSEVEFCAGMALDSGAQQLFLSYGVEDAKALVSTVALDRVLGVMHPI